MSQNVYLSDDTPAVQLSVGGADSIYDDPELLLYWRNGRLHFHWKEKDEEIYKSSLLILLDLSLTREEYERHLEAEARSNRRAQYKYGEMQVKLSWHKFCTEQEELAKKAPLAQGLRNGVPVLIIRAINSKTGSEESLVYYHTDAGYNPFRVEPLADQIEKWLAPYDLLPPEGKHWGNYR